jgi:hypothetical protein
MLSGPQTPNTGGFDCSCSPSIGGWGVVRRGLIGVIIMLFIVEVAATD